MEIEIIKQMSTPLIQVCSMYCKQCQAHRYYKYYEQVDELDKDIVDCFVECLKCHKITWIETRKVKDDKTPNN